MIWSLFLYSSSLMRLVGTLANDDVYWVINVWISCSSFYILIILDWFDIIWRIGLRRCYQCRSRGDLGSCKDPFKYNITQLGNEPGIQAVPCASGWCGKVIEGQTSLRSDGKTTDSAFFTWELPYVVKSVLK